MFVRFCTWCFLVGVSLLTACGGGGSGGGSPDGGSGPPSQVLEGDYLPAPTAALWTYAASDSTILTIKVVDERQMAEGRIATLENRWSDIPESFLSQTLRTTNDVRELGSQSTDAFTRALGDYSIVRLPLTVGSEFVQLDKTIEAGIDIDGDQISDRYTMRTVVRVAAVETITTLVGQHSAVRIRSVANRSYQSSVHRREVKGVFTTDEWYVRDIGLVRSETTLDRDDGTQSKFSYWITAFSVGGKRSETQAPTITLASPAAGSHVNHVFSLSLQFNEVIEPASVNERTVRLLDPTGQAVNLVNLQASGNQIYVSLNVSLGGGVHTFQVNGVTDQLGNGLVQSWTFEVDNTAPALVRTVPSANALDADPTAAITIEFSEDVNIAANNGASFAIYDASGCCDPVPSTVRVVPPRQVEIKPNASLKRRQKYRVNYYGSDRAGNPISGSYEFATAPEWFSYALRPVHVAAARATAIGDVTGDGRNDLVVVPTWSSAVPFVIHPQLQNGQLGEALPPPLAAPIPSCWGYWDVSSVQVVDVNNDGRRDVVVLASCGTVAFMQDANGGFTTTLVLADGSNSAVRFGDINGDGRADAVVSSAYSLALGSVAIRMQRPDGSFEDARIVASGLGAIGESAIVDLNGDGRVDLVFSGMLAPGRSLAWIAQTSDGGFSAPNYIAAPIDANLWRLVAADLNSDGRVDLVSMGSIGWPGGTLMTFMQGSDGSFVGTRIGTQGGASLAVSDTDADGRLDIVVGREGYGDVAIHRQQADGSFAVAQVLVSVITDYGVGIFAFGDLNGDGLMDWVTNRAELAYRIGDAPKLQALSNKQALRPGGEADALKRRLR